MGSILEMEYQKGLLFFPYGLIHLIAIDVCSHGPAGPKAAPNVSKNLGHELADKPTRLYADLPFCLLRERAEGSPQTWDQDGVGPCTRPNARSGIVLQ